MNIKKSTDMRNNLMYKGSNKDKTTTRQKIRSAMAATKSMILTLNKSSSPNNQNMQHTHTLCQQQQTLQPGDLQLGLIEHICNKMVA